MLLIFKRFRSIVWSSPNRTWFSDISLVSGGHLLDQNVVVRSGGAVDPTAVAFGSSASGVDGDVRLEDARAAGLNLAVHLCQY